MSFKILDWAGNSIANNFNNFDDAEDYLIELLADDYDTDRQEYYIEESA